MKAILAQDSSSSELQLYYRTRSICPQCGELVSGQVFARDGKIFLGRSCAVHGYCEGLVSSDQQWYESLSNFMVAPIKPRQPSSKSAKGCPEDCGLCAAHRQIAGTATIEISNKCNAACPICLADNQGTFEVSAKEVEEMIEQLLASQDRVDTVTLSGGEPTIHPEIFDIIEVLDRPEIDRVVINSNGVRICDDDAFLDRLARFKKVYVSLHFDGTKAKQIRGIEAEFQEKALQRLCQWNINVVPTIVGIRDVNDSELGSLVTELLTRSPQIKTVMISLMTYTGGRGSRFKGDALRRLTIPAALDAIEKSTAGLLKKTDFVPFTMPNPQCAAIGYFLVDGKDLIPLNRLGEVERIVNYTSNANFGRINEEFEQLLKDLINSVYATPEKYDNPKRLLRCFRELLLSLFPDDKTLNDAEKIRIAEGKIKSIYVFQLMDAWTFDTERLRKCSCQHLFPGKQVIPSCSYYVYHRRLDPRFQNPDPSI